MKVFEIKYLFVLTVIVLLSFSCENRKVEKAEFPAVNLNHLMHLYLEVKLPGEVNAGIVRIYSEYPDYTFEIEPNEGFTCVDDVARAMMIDAIRNSDDKIIKAKYVSMAEFLIYMQAENGWFHNFIWHDLSINKTYRTSIAEPNWWSWRAFWALSSYSGKEERMVQKVKLACERLAENAFQLYLNDTREFETIEGVKVPTWLPLGTAGDQAAVLILGLEAYYQHIKKDERALLLIEKLADGLILTQKGNAESFPFGAFLSWQNLWHAYGNGQAYAMLKAGQLLGREDFIESALLEIDHFYPYLIEKDFPAFFKLKKVDDIFELTESQAFPQIAYGFRPVIWACIEAFMVTGNQKYANRAKEITKWFMGNNIAGKQMYDASSGRCFDGIVSHAEVNMNSGAESTIEALLSLQVLNQIDKK